MASLFRSRLPRRFPRLTLSRDNALYCIEQRGFAAAPHHRYVWKEPPGRMARVLDQLRFAEQRWQYVRRKYMERLLETTRRARLSNDAWQPRLTQLEQQYQHLAYGMAEVAQGMRRLCADHGMEPPVTRRKYNFDALDAYIVGGEKYDANAAAASSDRSQPEEFVRPDPEADPQAPLLRPEVFPAERRRRAPKKRK